MENELRKQFPNEEFKFYDKAINIPINDRKTMDILIGYDGKIDRTFIEHCINLKWIGWFATGVNNLPLNYIKERDIILTNGKGIQAKQVSEYIMTFILHDYKKMKTSYRNQLEKNYDSRIIGKRLNEETLLFLGTGAIAQRAAYLAKAFGMKVIGVSKSGKNVEHFDEVYTIEELDDVIEKANIIVNALPETEETIYLLKRKDFIQMDNNALFINVGRGTIVDEEVLINVLKDRLIRHAYLDVFEKEPLSKDNPLYDLDNVTITAHITGNDSNNNREATDIFKKNLEHFLNNYDVIENKVDLDYGY
ncbi:hydroxyacid dehydrogenase [Staphylococcus epidermidis]|nr:hydroxyacid dehydrogenase [Staphylococcus epidermidis]